MAGSPLLPSPVLPGTSPKIVITMGEHFTVQASASKLKADISPSYWAPEMEVVCGGKIVGEAVRYTGENVVLVRFTQEKPNRSGKRYPFALSIPAKYLCPVAADVIRRARSLTQIGATAKEPKSATSVMGNSEESGGGLATSFGGFAGLGRSVPQFMCVVCGVMNQPGEMRKHGWKCDTCVGVASKNRLRDESQKIMEATLELAASLPAHHIALPSGSPKGTSSLLHSQVDDTAET
jgi:hypothetical protein